MSVEIERLVRQANPVPDVSALATPSLDQRSVRRSATVRPSDLRLADTVEGPTEPPDQHERRQRRLVVALAAAVVAVVGGLLVVRYANGERDESPAPADPVPSVHETLPTPTGMQSQELHPTIGGPMRTLTFDLPEDWPVHNVFTHLVARPEASEIRISNGYVTHVITEPCGPTELPKVGPAPGPTVDDLANAFVETFGESASAPRDVTIDGHPGRHVQFVAPPAPNCGGHYGRVPGDTTLIADLVFGHAHEMWILDVDGSRLAVWIAYPPGTSQDTVAQVRAAVESMRISPGL